VEDELVLGAGVVEEFVFVEFVLVELLAFQAAHASR